MKTFGEQVLDFFEDLDDGPPVPADVQILYPHQQPQARAAMEAFYGKYYGDNHDRIFLIGINPGRFGAGTTGIPFTDPIRLQEACGITNSFDKKAELSSKFIYQMITKCGGVKTFYANCYFTSVSPLGFISNGKNLNYYDRKEMEHAWESFMVGSLRKQQAFGASPLAFSLGQGKNYQYLQKINDKYQIFEDIRPLPHPRWVMQYRLKRLDEFLELYQSELQPWFG